MGSKKKIRWTEEKEKLYDLRFKQKKTLGAIAREYGVTRQNVSVLLHRWFPGESLAFLVENPRSLEKKWERLDPQYKKVEFWEDIKSRVVKGDEWTKKSAFYKESPFSKKMTVYILKRLRLWEKFISPQGEDNFWWKENYPRIVDALGYERIRVIRGKTRDEAWFALHPDWTWANVPAQKYIMEIKVLGGIEVSKQFHIHHVDGDRANNEIPNLAILPVAVHFRLHKLLKKGRLERELFEKIGRALGDYYLAKFQEFHKSPVLRKRAREEELKLAKKRARKYRGRLADFKDMLGEDREEGRIS